MSVKVALIILAVLILSQQVNARQCITPSVADSLTPGKQVEVYIAEDDHPQFSNPWYKCNYYLPYYNEGLKATGQPTKTISSCTADPSFIDLSKGFAPFGAFFRSKLSVPETDVASYHWEIRGSSGVLTTFDSFNAAYIFENEGNFTANLTVTLKNGTILTDEKSVTVWPRKGNTYYVDSILGDDRYNGLEQAPDLTCDHEGTAIGTCNGPWKTATRGFSVLSPRKWVAQLDGKYSAASVCSQSTIRTYTGNGIAANVKSCDTLLGQEKLFIKPGDQVLFKRGQTFEFDTGIITTATNLQPSCTAMVLTYHGQGATGLLFSSYGTGKKPKIINTAESSCLPFFVQGVGMFHLAFQDLDFDLQSSKVNPLNPKVKNRAAFLAAPTNMLNFIFNRVDLKKMDQGVGIYNTHGAFIKDSNFYDSVIVHVYSETSSDVALLNNKFDYSGNHILYADLSNSLIAGNKFSRQAFGRTQLRIAGTDPATHRTESVWITDNLFQGWVDPRTAAECLPGRCQFADGKSYNYAIIEFNPNNIGTKFSDRLVFRRNTLKNAQNMMRVTATANALIEDNIFDNRDGTSSPRLMLHATNWGERPLNGITIRNNLFVERNAIRADSPIIKIWNYENISGITCDDLPSHQDINITNNKFMSPNNTCLFGKSNVDGSAYSCLLNSTQIGSETQGALSGVTLTTNQLDVTTQTGTINQAIADKSTQSIPNLPLPPTPHSTKLNAKKLQKVIKQ